MTPDERRKQHIINGSRRKRIAKGSGTSVEEVNRLLKQFVQMQKMLKSARRDGRAGRRRQEGAPPGHADAAQPRIIRGARTVTARGREPRRRRDVRPVSCDRRSGPVFEVDSAAKQAFGFEPRRPCRRDRWSPFVCVAPVPRSVRSSASSSPIRAPRATAASSKSSATTTRAPSRRSSTSTQERVDYWIEQGRAAVRFGAHADRASPDARTPARRRGRGGRGARGERRRERRVPACARSSRCWRGR